MIALRIIFTLLAVLPLLVAAQTIETRKESSRIEGTNKDGYQVVIAAPENEVRTSLSQYLKAIGRTKMSGDYITVSEPLIGGKKYDGVLYATVKEISAGSAAWMGMLSASSEHAGLDRNMDKLVYDFGVEYHREKIQLQIDESLRALQVVEKQQARLLSQNKDLNNRLENNKRQKIELEKSLISNEVELDDLTRRLAANVRAQDSVSVATGQIRKVVEMHREKQKRVH